MLRPTAIILSHDAPHKSHCSLASWSYDAKLSLPKYPVSISAKITQVTFYNYPVPTTHPKLTSLAYSLCALMAFLRASIFPEGAAFGSSMARQKASDSAEQERMVSVRPRWNLRVAADSYVAAGSPCILPGDGRSGVIGVAEWWGDWWERLRWGVIGKMGDRWSAWEKDQRYG